MMAPLPSDPSNVGAAEIPLPGGRITQGVVRVGETVRRPLGSNSAFVHELLRHLEAVGFEGAPRLLGLDERGREVLTFLKGDVPHDPVVLTDHQLGAAARLVRQFHDATAGSRLAGTAEIVCHTDLGPHNTVFSAGVPVAFIDWDGASPGSRLSDFANAVSCYVNVGIEGGTIPTQARRIRLMCDAYGLDEPVAVVDEIAAQLQEALARHGRAGRAGGVRVFSDLVAWMKANGPRLKAAL